MPNLPDTSTDLTTTPGLDELLGASNCTPEFREAVLQLAQLGKGGLLIRFQRQTNPSIKVMRVIMGLLERFPKLPIAELDIAGESGCSDYRGTITVTPGDKRFRFAWDCAWKARQMDWNDFFGDPDQIRAAKEFGHRCFEVFEELPPN